MKTVYQDSFQYSFFLLIAFASVCGLLSACGRKEFKDYVRLDDDLRVIALHTTTPEVNPGTTVSFTPVISDQGGSGAITETAQACTDPGVGFGAEPSCEGQTLFSVSTAAAQSLDPFTRVGTGTVYTVTAPLDYLSGVDAITQFNGRILLFTYTIRNSRGKTVRSFARLIVSSALKTSKNQNPGLTAILGDGVPLSTIPSVSVTASVQLPAGAAETYNEFDLTGTLKSKTETIQTTWFLIRGEFSFFRTLANDPNPYTPDPSGLPNAWVVVTRDGRGGESIRTLGLGTNLNLQ